MALHFPRWSEEVDQEEEEAAAVVLVYLAAEVVAQADKVAELLSSAPRL